MAWSSQVVCFSLICRAIGLGGTDSESGLWLIDIDKLDEEGKVYYYGESEEFVHDGRSVEAHVVPI